MEMLRAYGHTIIREEPAGGYVEKDLLRSISAAVLMQGGIPAITVELGDPEIPDPAAVAAAVAGTRNIMRWAGMLPGEMESIQGIAVIDPGFPVQWRFTLRAPQAGVVLHLVKPGDQVKVGDRLAEMRDVWGQPIGDGYLYSEYDGFVIGHPGGVYYYPGESTCCLSVRDETPLVAPYPVGYL